MCVLLGEVGDGVVIVGVEAFCIGLGVGGSAVGVHGGTGVSGQEEEEVGGHEFNENGGGGFSLDSKVVWKCGSMEL